MELGIKVIFQNKNCELNNSLFKGQMIGKTNLKWANRFPQLLVKNSGTQPVGGYEIYLNSNGLPVKLTPINKGDLEENEVKLLEVFPDAYKAAPCKKLVFKKGQQWTLTAKGKTHINLLMY